MTKHRLILAMSQMVAWSASAQLLAEVTLLDEHWTDASFALATSYGIASGGVWTTADFDLDGDVDLSDLGVLATNYGAGSAQAFADFQSLQSVPEPSSLICIALGCAYASRTFRCRLSPYWRILP